MAIAHYDLFVIGTGNAGKHVAYDAVEAGLNVARYYEKHHNFILQELYLRRTFHELLEKICDSLIHNAIRKQCLAQLYKPQLALKRYYKTHNCIEKYFSLEREACLLSQEFNPI